MNFVLQHRDADAYKMPLLTSELIKGGGHAVAETGKSALIGAVAAVGTLVVTSLLSSAYAYATGHDDPTHIHADASGHAPLPVAKEAPLDLPVPLTLPGVMPEDSGF